MISEACELVIIGYEIEMIASVLQISLDSAQEAIDDAMVMENEKQYNSFHDCSWDWIEI